MAYVTQPQRDRERQVQKEKENTKDKTNDKNVYNKIHVCCVYYF